MIFDSIAVVAAFMVGFAMKRGGLCTYAAALQIVRSGQFERLFAFLGAAAWTVVAIVPLRWFWTDAIQQVSTHSQWSLTLIGGVLLGLGAYLNRGCVFGTFVQLVGGNLTYLFTLLGLACGAVFAKAKLSTVLPVLHDSALTASPGFLAFLWLGVAILFIAYCLVQQKTSRDKIIMFTLGIGGGWLFSTVQGWDFAAVITNTTYYFFNLQLTGPSFLAVVCTIAMVGGGITAAVVSKNFSIRTPQLWSSVGSFLGGVLMGSSSLIIPGGNDSMLLKGIPALAPHSVFGYVMMVAIMLLLLAIIRNDRGFSVQLLRKNNA